MPETIELPKEILDKNHLKQIAGDDRVFIKELFELFIDNSGVSMRKFEQAIENGDEDSWYNYAHALKGSSSSIGAFRVSKLFNQAQNLPAISSREEKIQIFEQIKKEYEKLVSHLREEMNQ